MRQALFVAEKPSMSKAITEILSNGRHTSRAGKNKFCRNYDFETKVKQRAEL